MASVSRPTASGTRASSAFINRAISSADSVSIFSEAGLRASVVMRVMQANSRLCILGRRLSSHSNRNARMDFLGWLDILVLVAYFTSAVLVGVLVSGRNKDVESFLVGDRNLP